VSLVDDLTATDEHECILSLISSTCCFRTTRNVRENRLTIQPKFVVLSQEFLRPSQFRICLSGDIPEIVLIRQVPVLETVEDLIRSFLFGGASNGDRGQFC